MSQDKDLIINLQLFAGEKTERATPRRREEARKKGQVAKSNEIVTVVVLALTLLVLRAWIPNMAREFQNLFIMLMSFAQGELTQRSAHNLIIQTLLGTAKILLPVLLTAVAAGYLANVMQIGFLFVSEPLRFDPGRISPFKGFKRIFSKRAIAELLKSLLKTCLVGYAAVSYLWQEMPSLSVLMDLPVIIGLATIGKITFAVCWRVLAILFIMAGADYAYQLYEYEQSLRMSKQEVKEEYKNIEGDPHIKAKIKEKQRQMATRRMMQEVPKSTVVITNPTHIAVAIKYENDMAAPMVIAKGQDHIAQRIKELARENQVTVVENKPLAWLLYKRVEIGTYIPADLYQAVAEVIAYVYKLKKIV